VRSVSDSGASFEEDELPDPESCSQQQKDVFHSPAKFAANAKLFASTSSAAAYTASNNASSTGQKTALGTQISKSNRQQQQASASPAAATRNAGRLDKDQISVSGRTTPEKDSYSTSPECGRSTRFTPVSPDAKDRKSLSPGYAVSGPPRSHGQFQAPTSTALSRVSLSPTRQALDGGAGQGTYASPSRTPPGQSKSPLRERYFTGGQQQPSTNLSGAGPKIVEKLKLGGNSDVGVVVPRPSTGTSPNRSAGKDSAERLRMYVKSKSFQFSHDDDGGGGGGGDGVVGVDNQDRYAYSAGDRDLVKNTNNVRNVSLSPRGVQSSVNSTFVSTCTSDMSAVMAKQVSDAMAKRAAKIVAARDKA
jgi:hypothetical protein